MVKVNGKTLGRTAGKTLLQHKKDGKTNEAVQLSAQPHLGQEHNNLVFYLTRCKSTGFP